MCNAYLQVKIYFLKAMSWPLMSMMNSLTLSDSFAGLATYLGCTEILEIHYDDMDVELESVSDADIEDFQNEFTFGMEILEGLIRDGIISDEQIEKYNLQYLISTSDEEDDYEV